MKNSAKIIMLLFTFLVFRNLSYSQISGNKTIGGTNPDYATINNAIAALKTNGINGDVTFNIRDGVYTEKLDISNISGSQTYNIIFQSESQDTAKVKITFTATAGSTHLVNMTKIKNITFKFLSFHFSGSYSCKIVNMVDSVVNIKFHNNYFKCLNTSAYIIYAPAPLSGQKSLRQLEFANNTFESGYSAIELLGGYYGIISKLVITNNIFKNQKSNGIYLSSCEGIKISSNTITSTNSTNNSADAFSIGLEYGKDFEITNNKIYTSFFYGISLYGCSNSASLMHLVTNNFVTIKIDPSGMSGIAMQLTNTTYADIIHNTLRLIGGNTGVSNYGLNLSGSSNIKVVNNIIHNNESFAISLDSNTGIAIWNYNYVSGGSTYFAHFGSHNCASLTEWQQESTLDTNSVSGNITFISASDLHVNSQAVNDKGTAWASVTTDIDGETRNATTPDIGADEFTITNLAPVITNQTFSINENSLNGTAVGTVVATDADAGQTLIYSITAGNTSNAFAINSSTGAITVNTSSALNYEAVTSLSLSVEVIDNGTVSLSSSATITINITNVNEAPFMSDQSFTINENTSNSTKVGKVLGSDVDASPYTHTYSIIAGNTSDAFIIVGIGDIYVHNSLALNFETTPSYKLTVVMSDRDTPPLSDTATITINLTDINESPVIANQTFSINEKSPNGAAVGTVLASDPDAGQTLTYSITDGNTGNAFAINSATGAITVNNASEINYATNPSFSLSINAADNGTNSLASSATITVNLTRQTDINLLSNDQSFLIYPNPSQGIVYIKSKTSMENNIDIEVYDITGKLKLRKENAKINETLNLSDLSGVLFVKMISVNRTFYQKLIIQK